jgi:hypothetical protein
MLSKWYYYVNPAIELICFIISLFCLTNKRVGWYKHFLWFLLLTVIVENVGYFTYFYFNIKNNHWIYNTYLPILTFFIGWVLFKVGQPHFNSKALVLSGLVVFTISYLIESIKSHFTEYSAIASILFSICTIIICFIYYFRLLNDETNITISTHEPFWIISGIFIYYFVSTSANFFFKYLIEINKIKLVPIRYSIFLFLNLALYGTWAYAFICKQKKTISSS